MRSGAEQAKEAESSRNRTALRGTQEYLLAASVLAMVIAFRRHVTARYPTGKIAKIMGIVPVSFGEGPTTTRGSVSSTEGVNSGLGVFLCRGSIDMQVSVSSGVRCSCGIVAYQYKTVSRAVRSSQVSTQGCNGTRRGLHRFRCLRSRQRSALLQGGTSRESFQPWEVELLLDIQNCQIKESTREGVLRRIERGDTSQQR